MIASEFTAADPSTALRLRSGQGSGQRGTPATDLAKAVVEGCLKRHLMLLTCGPWGNTVRWIPPLVVTLEQIEEAVGVFREALAESSSDSPQVASDT
mgnify:FL=1